MRRDLKHRLLAVVLVGVTLAACSSGSSGGESAATDTSGASGATATTDATTTSTTARESTTTSAPTTTTTAPPRETRLSMVFTGDFLTHTPVMAAARTADGGYDFVPLLERVAPLVQEADLAICHMEVPLSEDNRDLGGYPLFSAPSESASSMVAAGYDGCSTASNHSLDRGFGGVSSTLDVFDRAGLVHAGTGRSEEEALAPGWYEVEGLRIAHLSYTYGTNGIPLPADAPWSVRLIDAPAVIADASRARGEGADVVVVSLHWGNEYQSAPTDAQRTAADAITRDGAVDLVVGHHAHVPQPAEQVNGRWVLFGLGNFLSNQSAACCSAASQDGVLATADLVVRESDDATTAEVERIGFSPIRVDRAADYRVTPVAEALAGATPTSMSRDELTASLQRTVDVFAAQPHPQLALHEPPG